MRNELSDRQQAIRMRLAGDSVSWISRPCAARKRGLGNGGSAISRRVVKGFTI